MSTERFEVVLSGMICPPNRAADLGKMVDGVVDTLNEAKFWVDGIKIQQFVDKARTDFESTVIIINGKPYTTYGWRIYYETVVSLAFPGREGVFTVTHHRPDGSLVPGQHCIVRPGMIFNVADTSKA